MPISECIDAGDECAEYALDRCEQHCVLAHCHSAHHCIIYGLYDKRAGDIFYVGKTINMTRRFSEHLHSHPYVQAMLERGLFPLPIILCEFSTWCDVYSRRVENAIAQQLREQGHSAFSDDTKCAWTLDHWFYPLVEEQAHRIAVLSDIWLHFHEKR